ncbi:MAG TPA: hypothetical protein DCK95_04205 [Anaerolineaceae bacterium]|nr:hypothetical protein [Anaerolineaceae bacterium]
MQKMKWNPGWLFFLVMIIGTGCARNAESKIDQIDQSTPDGPQNTTSEIDLSPPIIHMDNWESPQPLPAPIDAEGDELSPFITLAGDELYYFYTPDLSASEAKQALDGISGTYFSEQVNGVWSEPQKLNFATENSLDGCIYTVGQTLWFCSRREGNYGDVDFYTATWVDGAWRDVRNAGEQLNVTDDVGDMHLSADQNTMIFSAFRTGGFGLTDLWQIQRVGESWSEPVNLGDVINGIEMDDYPFLSEDGLELWFTSPSRMGYPGFAIFRSIWQDGAWGEPQEIISNNVSEVSIDRQGNLYFTHIIYSEEGELQGSKIYVAFKKNSTSP